MSTLDPPAPRGEVTELLAAWGTGDPEAPQRVFELLYDELRRIAHRARADQRHEQTLQTTALVHELYLRLRGGFRPAHDDRRHFFGAAAKAMRCILIDRARERLAAKRGGGVAPVPLDEAALEGAEADATEALAIDEALRALEALDSRLAELVELRYFAGLSVDETGRLLGLSAATVKRDWQKARALLADWISGKARPPDRSAGTVGREPERR